MRAGDHEETAEVRSEAFNDLCRIYWKSIYAFLGRSGKFPSDAEVVTQDLFASLVGHNVMSMVECTHLKNNLMKLLCFLPSASPNVEPDNTYCAAGERGWQDRRGWWSMARERVGRRHCR